MHWIRSRRLAADAAPERRCYTRAALRVVFRAVAVLLLCRGSAAAGVVNPDISIIGEPFLRITNAPDDPSGNHVTLDPGETEVVFDAYLNPYAKGFFTLAIGDEGLGLEEGFFHLLRGLPGGLALKGGKYRAGFGRLNAVHPHAYPFAERFGVLAAYLPGDEALNETGLSLSDRVPLAGDASVNASLDWLQGNSLRVERTPSDDPADPLLGDGGDLAERSRPAFLGRVSSFAMLGERSGLEVGASFLRGTNNVAARSVTTVAGADAKAKLWTSPRSYLLVQAEALALRREEAAWMPGRGYETSRVTPAGGYVYADYNFETRYNVGGSFERYQEPAPDEPWTEAFGLFAGFALLEETTAFRGDWVRRSPDGGDVVDTFTLRVIYSMGPHKAHQF
jgi:hypothetical protein